MSESLYAIDVFSLVFQVFHAIPPMTSPSGRPTNAVFGFTRDILNILKVKQPDYLVCAIDTPGRGTREDIYPEYKANRDEMPEELRPQIPVIIEVIKAFGIPAISVEGWEADDVLATLSRHANEAKVQTAIVTGDKDARQLITPFVRVYNVRKDVYLDEAALLDDWGVRPDQVVDFQALVGDKVDNVPGVPLVGPKKASALLEKFGTLEDVLARADEAPGKKLSENLKTYADQARISRQLVELNTKLDFEFSWDHARVGQLDVAQLSELFRECGFRRFIDEVRELTPDEPVETNSLFENGGPAVEMLSGNSSIDDLITKLSDADAISLRLERDGLDSLNSRVVALTAATDDQSAAFVPVDELVSAEPADRDSFASSLAKLLAPGKPALSGHDLKSTLLSLRNLGVHECELGLDTMVGSYLLSAGSRSHSLSQLIDRYFGSPLERLSSVLSENEDSECRFTLDGLARHSAEEACLMLRVGDRMRKELEEQELWKLYDEVERPLIAVLAEMERTGICVDAEELGRQNEEATTRIDELISEIHKEADEEFNIDSPKQLRVILFDKLGLPVIKKTKTGPSTDQDVLEQLAADHTLPAKIIEYRHLVKLRGTYLEALPKLISPTTGRIHAQFNQVVAATGRLSSSNPNLQNIPIRTAKGERIRRAFVPGKPDWKLLCADYSQIELRIVAHFSGDKVLQRAFADGIDIHRAVAAQVFGIDPEAVDSNQRRIAKAVNFGVIYGQSPFGLSQALGIEREEAAAFIDEYFIRYSGVAAFLDVVLEECLETGFVRTILGRRRAINGVRPIGKRHGQLNMPERTAVNTVIQGSAADLIKRAMINIDRRLRRESSPARMLLQIHDELVFETPESDVDQLAELVRTEMESAMTLSVPLTVDLATGDNWLDAKS